MEGQPTREVRFSRSADDLFKLHFHSLREQPTPSLLRMGGRRLQTLAPVGVFIILAGVIALAAGPAEWWETTRRLFDQFLVGFLGALSGIVSLIFLVAWTCRPPSYEDFVRHLANTPRLSHEETVRISPDGVRWETCVREVFLRWHGVTRLLLSNDFLLIYDAPDSAVMVPRRAFPQRHYFVEFAELARQYHEQSRPPVDPSSSPKSLSPRPGEPDELFP